MMSKAKCIICGYEWYANYPWQASTILECPKCGNQKSQVTNCIITYAEAKAAKED